MKKVVSGGPANALVEAIAPHRPSGYNLLHYLTIHAGGFSTFHSRAAAPTIRPHHARSIVAAGDATGKIPRTGPADPSSPPVTAPLGPIRPRRSAIGRPRRRLA